MQVEKLWVEPTPSAYRASNSRILLLKLFTPLRLDEYTYSYVSPVTLPNEDLPVRNLSQCILLGYGLINLTGGRSKSLDLLTCALTQNLMLSIYLHNKILKSSF